MRSAEGCIHTYVRPHCTMDFLSLFGLWGPQYPKFCSMCLDIINNYFTFFYRRFVFLHFENEEKAKNALKDILKSGILKKPTKVISKKKSSKNVISTSTDGLKITNQSK